MTAVKLDGRATAAAIKAELAERVAKLKAAGVTGGPLLGVHAAIITVQPGYTLWGIAERNLGKGVLYVKVFQANRDQIRDPNLIYPGQVFAVPGAP